MTIAEHIPRDKHILMDFHGCSDVMQTLSTGICIPIDRHVKRQN
jgi:hypothetical protein